MRKRYNARIRVIVMCAMWVAAVLPAATLGGPAAHAASNPIVLENQNPGTTDWQIDYDSVGNPLLATSHQIEGYASITSVNVGSQISFMVNVSSAAQYTMKIFRTGYY